MKACLIAAPVCLMVLLFGLLFGSARCDEPQPMAGPADDRTVMVKAADVRARALPDDISAAVNVDLTALWLRPLRTQDDWIYVDAGWLRESDCVRSDQALEYFTSQIEKSPTPFGYLSRSMAWMLSSQHDKALADITEALLLVPQSARAFIVRGILTDAQGREQETLDNFNRAIELDPRDPFGRDARRLAMSCRRAVSNTAQNSRSSRTRRPRCRSK